MFNGTLIIADATDKSAAIAAGVAIGKPLMFIGAAVVSSLLPPPVFVTPPSTVVLPPLAISARLPSTSRSASISPVSRSLMTVPTGTGKIMSSPPLP